MIEYPLVGSHLIRNQKDSIIISLIIDEKNFARIIRDSEGIKFEYPAKLSKRELKFLSIHNPTFKF